MNPKYFGDSYDLVKRFFCLELRRMNFHVSIDPMLTGDWSGGVDKFYLLLGVNPTESNALKASSKALFVDPDTGIGSKASKQHVSYTRLASEAAAYDLVFAFDQSFSRGEQASVAIRRKIALFSDFGLSAMVYDSHARFLFLAQDDRVLADLRMHFCEIGMPEERFVRG